MKKLGLDKRDVVGLLGITLLGVGCGMIYLPAGFAIPGAIVVAVSVFGVRG